MPKNTGGPAFPTATERQELSENGYRQVNDLETGMTLRDYFAAKALTGPVQFDYMQAAKQGHEMSCEYMALLAYQLADAMLKARET